MPCEAVKTVVQVSKIVWLELERKVGLDVVLALSGQLTHQALCHQAAASACHCHSPFAPRDYFNATTI